MTIVWGETEKDWGGGPAVRFNDVPRSLLILTATFTSLSLVSTGLIFIDSLSELLSHIALKDTFVSIFALYVTIWPLQLFIFKQPSNPKLIPFHIHVFAVTSVYIFAPMTISLSSFSVRDNVLGRISNTERLPGL
jgi:hypothetical protein